MLMMAVTIEMPCAVYGQILGSMYVLSLLPSYCPSHMDLSPQSTSSTERMSQDLGKSVSTLNHWSEAVTHSSASEPTIACPMRTSSNTLIRHFRSVTAVCFLLPPCLVSPLHCIGISTRESSGPLPVPMLAVLPPSPSVPRVFQHFPRHRLQAESHCRACKRCTHLRPPNTQSLVCSRDRRALP